MSDTQLVGFGVGMEGCAGAVVELIGLAVVRRVVDRLSIFDLSALS